MFYIKIFVYYRSSLKEKRYNIAGYIERVSKSCIKLYKSIPILLSDYMYHIWSFINNS